VLAEILQRSTAMPVSDAVDQMPVAPNHVYVIPPNREMQIFHGLLQLSMPEVARGHRMPIDTFLRSLAEDQAEYAVGIILSGTGTDGTLGLRAILGAGGVTLVQEPTSAKYDGMPQSALRAGFASHSLPVEHMAGTLQSIARNLAANLPAPVTPVAAADLNRLLLLLRSLRDTFSLYSDHFAPRRATALHELTDARAAWPARISRECRGPMKSSDHQFLPRPDLPR
jgi:two-component system CheB/CheR fusion protein